VVLNVVVVIVIFDSIGKLIKRARRSDAGADGVRGVKEPGSAACRGLFGDSEEAIHRLVVGGVGDVEEFGNGAWWLR